MSMSDFRYNDAGARQMGHGQVHTAYTLAHDTSNAPSRVRRLPYYTLDPATLMDQSIEAQLQRLYERPAFDANPAHHYQQEMAFTWNPYQGRETRGSSRALLRPASATTLPYEVYDTVLSGAQPMHPRRPASSTLPFPSALPRSPYASSVTMRGVLSRPDGRWSRQRRKEELIENSLEPLQNLVGLDSYFVERPHFAYHPLSPTTLPASRPARSDCRGGGGKDVVGYCNGTRAAPSGLSQTSLGSLPMKHGRQSTQPLAGMSGSSLHSCSSPTSATAYVALQGIGAASGGVLSARAEGTSKLLASTTEARAGKAKITTASSTASSSGSCTSSSDTDAEVFFDEDPLNTQWTPSDVHTLAEGSKSSPRSSPPLQKSRGGEAAAPTAQGGARDGRLPLPTAPTEKPTPLPLRGITPVETAPVTTPHGALHNVIGTAATTFAAEEQSTLPQPRPPSLDTSPTAAAELDPSTAGMRRRSIDALLEHLLRLRLQHQHPSFTTTKCPSLPTSVAPPSSDGQQKPQARRSGGNHAQSHRSSASCSRKPGDLQRRVPPSKRSAHESLHSPEEGPANGENGDGVYVRLYRRYRRCECCEVPLPKEIVRPQPPPSRGTVRDGRPHRGRRPRVALTSEMTSTYAAPPLPSQRLRERNWHAYADFEEDENREDHNSAVPLVEGDCDPTQPRPPSTPPAAVEHALGQQIAQEDGTNGAGNVGYIIAVLRSLIKDLRDTHQQQHRRQPYDESPHGHTKQSGNSNERGLNDEDSRKPLLMDVVMDESFAAELLRLLSSNERAPPAMPDYAVPPLVSQQQPYYPPPGPYRGTAFPRPSPYPPNALLYPYNIPHPPRHDELVATMPFTAGATQDVITNAKLSDEEALAAHLPLTPQSGEATGIQPAEEEPQHEKAPSEESSQVPKPPPSPSAPSRVVENKCVQTCPSSSRRESDAVEAGRDSKEKQSADAAAATTSKNDAAYAATHTTPPESTASLHDNDAEYKSETAGLVAALVLPASLSSFGAPSLAAMTRSPLPPSPVTPTLQELEPLKSETTTAAAATGADFQAAIQKSVMEAQIELLNGMEVALRSRLREDEADARHDIALAVVQHAEVAERCSLVIAEAKERAPLQRGCRYCRDRLLVMEMALKEWSRALEEERDAWTHITADETVAAAAVKQQSEAKARVKALMEELLYEEAHARLSVRLTESLVRQELQISICDYGESYSREDLQYTELVAWLEMQRTFLLTLPQPAHRSPSPTLGNAESSHDERNISTHTCSNPYVSDLATSANQSHLQDHLQNKEAVELAEVAGHDHHSDDVRTHTEEAEDVPSQSLTPARLLSNEAREKTAEKGEEGEEDARRVVTSSRDSGAYQREHNRDEAEETPTSGVCEADAPAEEHPDPLPPPATDRVASYPPSSASDLSGAMVFSTGAATPTPEVSDHGIDELPALTSSSAVAVPVTTAPSASGDVTVLAEKVAVHVAKKNVLVSTAAMTIVPVPEALPVAELVSSALKTPLQDCPGTSTEPAGAAEGGGTSSEAEGSHGMADRSAERCRGATVSPGLTVDGGGDEEAVAIEDRAYRSADLSFVAEAKGDGNAAIATDAGAEVDITDSVVEQQAELTRTADELDRSEGQQDLRTVTTSTPSSDLRGRHSIISPLTSAAAASPAPATTAPELEQRASSNKSDHPSAASPQETMHDTDTDSESHSTRSTSSAVRHKRRQRRKVRHRTAVAAAIEIEEAGEIRGPENSEDGSDTDAGGEVPVHVATVPLDAQLAPTPSHGTAPPPPWGEIGESSGCPQTLTFHSGVDTMEMSDGEEKQGSHKRLERGHGVGSREDTPFVGANAALKNSTKGAKESTQLGKNAEQEEEEKVQDDVGVETKLPGNEEDNGAFKAGALGGFAAPHPLAATKADAHRATVDDGGTSVPSLQAENINFESSIDDRRFLSPLSTRSEVTTTHVNSQEDYSYCSTAVSARPPREERAKTDAVILLPDGRGFLFDHERVQLPAALAGTLLEPARVSATEDDDEPHNQQHLQGLMPSLSASSLSSPHLPDQDGDDIDEGKGKEKEGVEAASANRAGGDAQSKENSTTLDKYARCVASGREGCEADDSSMRSSCTGKDEVTLMHERVEAMKKTAHNHAAHDRSRHRTVTVGPGVSNANGKSRLSIDSQHLDQGERRASHTKPLSHLDDTSHANGRLPESKWNTFQQSHRSSSQREKVGVPHASFVEPTGEEARPECSPNEELASGAVSHSSLSGSPGSGSVARSKTQGTFYGSLDSDALTPVTRRMRAKCWEENGAATSYDPEAVPRPPTPEFVRNVLAVQLNTLVSETTVPEERSGTLAAVHLPLPHISESDRTTAAAEARWARTSEPQQCGHPSHVGNPFASYGVRAEPDIREEFPWHLGANYVKSGDNSDHDDPLPLAVTGSTNNTTHSGKTHTEAYSTASQPPSSGTRSSPASGAVAAAAVEDAGGTVFHPIAAVPHQPPFPWEAAAESGGARVAETNALIPLKQSNDDLWNGGTSNCFMRLRVRVPSPHPKALWRNTESRFEESTSASADDESSSCTTPNVNDTRLMTGLPNASLRSEDLAVAGIQKSVPMHLVNSPSESALLDEM
jgi:hypothetical protein